MQKVKHDAGVRFSVTRTTEINIRLDGEVEMVNAPLYGDSESDEEKTLLQMSSNLMSLLDTRHIITAIYNSGIVEEASKKDVTNFISFLGNLCEKNAYYLTRIVMDEKSDDILNDILKNIDDEENIQES